MLKGDSMLWTLHSDTKINISDPNLNVKMFNHYFFSTVTCLKMKLWNYYLLYLICSIIILYSCWPIVSCNTSQIFFCYTDSLKWFQNYFYYISSKCCEKKHPQLSEEIFFSETAWISLTEIIISCLSVWLKYR